MEYQKTADANGDLIGNIIANSVANSYDRKITKVLISSSQNNSDKEIPKEGYISPEERQKIIDNLTLI